MFSSPIPSFNFEGHSQVGTSIGCVFSVIMTMAMLGYGGYKTIVLVNRKNPSVSAYVLNNAYDKNFTMDLNSIGFNFAFYVENENTHEPIDNLDLVEWAPMLI